MSTHPRTPPLTRPNTHPITEIGKSGTSQVKVNGTKTLSNLTSGNYRLKAKAVSTPRGRAKATKQTRKVKVRITAKKGAQVLVLYVTPGTV